MVSVPRLTSGSVRCTSLWKTWKGRKLLQDDFLIAGCGNTEIEVNQRLERNERAFLEKWNLKLNNKPCKSASTIRRNSWVIYSLPKV